MSISTVGRKVIHGISESAYQSIPYAVSGLVVGNMSNLDMFESAKRNKIPLKYSVPFKAYKAAKKGRKYGAGITRIADVILDNRISKSPLLHTAVEVPMMAVIAYKKSKKFGKTNS